MLHKANGSIQGTSIFDPVLMELCVKWFCPRPKLFRHRPVVVVDPFAGGCVRGLVSAAHGLLYIGIDVSERQVLANRQQLAEAKRSKLRELTYDPTWIVGDGEDVVPLVRAALAAKGLDAHTQADFVCTCPCARRDRPRNPLQRALHCQESRVLVPC